MKIKSQRDFWAGLMFVAIGLGFAWGALNYRFGTSAQPGPGYFPFGLGILLALLGAFTLFESLTIDTDDGEPVGSMAWKPVVVILGAITLFGLLLPRLGLIIALPVLVVTSALAGHEFKWGEALFAALILTVASWAIFSWGLSLPLPLWPTFLAP
jgi:hypothetical protein